MPVAGSNSAKNVNASTDIDIDLDSDSDYGWDLSLEEGVHELLDAAAEATEEILTPSARSRLLVPVVAEDTVHNDAAASQSLAAAASGASPVPHHDPVADDDDPSAAAVLDAALLSFNVDYPDLSQIVADLSSQLSDPRSTEVKEDKGKDLEVAAAAIAAGAPAIASETTPGFARPSLGPRPSHISPGSPLVQFRAYPKKPLSVSDLTAGAWCELQYEYTLTRLPGGRRTRTPAMKAGSKVHQKLEDEVHTTIPITVKKPQDFLGVKIWNMIHGLRALRETGLTRELDIWGLVDVVPPQQPQPDGAPNPYGTRDMHKEVVNGVIDALSYQNPDPAAQEEASKAAATSFSTVATASTGSQITDYFPSSPLDPLSQQQATNVGNKEPPAEPPRKIYITDVKTRESARLPSGAAARPSKIQLFLYHRFLSDLAADRLRFDLVFNRYQVNEYEPFSEDFLNEMHYDVLYHDQWSHLENLYDFVWLLKKEVRLTFPQGADSIGDVVAVEYRQRPREAEEVGNFNKRAPNNGRCIGTNVIPVDSAVLDRYLANYMDWWRGARQPVGVDIEEASLKCGYCEFAEGCDWRQKMDEERGEKARAKMAAARGGKSKGRFTV